MIKMKSISAILVSVLFCTMLLAQSKPQDNKANNTLNTCLEKSHTG